MQSDTISSDDTRMALAVYRINRCLPGYELDFLENLAGELSSPPSELAPYLKPDAPRLRLVDDWPAG